MPSSHHRAGGRVPHHASNYGTFCRTVSLGVGRLRLRYARDTTIPLIDNAITYDKSFVERFIWPRFDEATERFTRWPLLFDSVAGLLIGERLGDLTVHSPANPRDQLTQFVVRLDLA